MADYVRTTGDLSHTFTALLSDGNGPIGLTASDVVTFRSRKLGETAFTTNSPATIVAPDVAVGDPNRGFVRYAQVAEDVANSGVYFITWVVQFFPDPPTIVQSFPEGSSEILILT